jgi:hypothetical protein
MANDYDKPVIALESAFKFAAVDKVEPTDPVGLKQRALAALDPNAGLGPLEPMLGTWKGNGFNTIFRPLNLKSPQDKKTFPIPATGDNVLELNLTSESTTFTAINGEIPNRGTIQPDIELSGMVYLQQISDVTTLPNTGIHIEPGIWIVIPTAANATASVRVTRMASIPHGATVNAQGGTSSFAGPPKIPPVNITPSLLDPPTGGPGVALILITPPRGCAFAQATA